MIYQRKYIYSDLRYPVKISEFDFIKLKDGDKMEYNSKNNQTENISHGTIFHPASPHESSSRPIVIKRRRFLTRAAELGALIIASPLSITSISHAFSATKRKPTAPDALGPFYKRDAPHKAFLRAPGDPGLPLKLSGSVYSEKGAALPDAKLEIWQTNAAGIYDTIGNRYRTTLLANPKGNYALESVMPGHYPARVCQHVHYLVHAEGHKPLVTELYFATDPVFEGDPDKNYHRDPVITSRDLVRPVTITGEPDSITADVNFDLILEAL
jgi:protocatechuate 3,4-dioxygenase beta subunit